MHEFRRTNPDPIYGFDLIEFLHLSDYKGFGKKSLTKLQVRAIQTVTKSSKKNVHPFGHVETDL